MSAVAGISYRHISQPVIVLILSVVYFPDLYFGIRQSVISIWKLNRKYDSNSHPYILLIHFIFNNLMDKLPTDISTSATSSSATSPAESRTLRDVVYNSKRSGGNYGSLAKSQIQPTFYISHKVE